jgi:hypothetical protein
MWKQENNHDGGPQGMTGTLTAYTEAVTEFSVNATEFLEHITLFTRAFEAYQRAMAVSTELRNTLDTGDETLRTLMTQMEQVIARVGKAASDTKKPGAVKMETSRASEENTDAADRKRPEAVRLETSKAS